jgi:hypothetical protein
VRFSSYWPLLDGLGEDNMIDNMIERLISNRQIIVPLDSLCMEREGDAVISSEVYNR